MKRLMKINLERLSVRPVSKIEEPRYRELMQQYHYLSDQAKMGHRFRYVATYGEEGAALLSFSAAAWKCSARDRWIGWCYRHYYNRLNFIANNSRFLIVTDGRYPNLGSKVLFLSQRPHHCRLADAFWQNMITSGNLRRSDTLPWRG